MSRVINFLNLSEETATDLTMIFYTGEDGVINCQLSPIENITGWTLKYTVRKDKSLLPILITKTVGVGITITDAPNSKFTISMDNADTTSATPGDYFFDIQRTNAGFHSELGIGVLTLLQPVAAM